MSRLIGLVVVLALLLGGCSEQADPAAPAERRSTPSPAAVPFRLDSADALAAVRSLRPRGFTRVLTCPTRKPQDCRLGGTQRTRWLVGTQFRGRALPRGHGLREFVRVVVTEWPSPGAATSYAGRLTRQLKHYDGEYDVLLRRIGPRRYVPADRGRGELHEVSFVGWRGAALRRIFHYVFAGPSPSAAVPGGRVVLRRERYVVDLEWVARDQRTDRRLSRVPRFLVRGLVRSRR
jgi:hypothetical protein